MAPHPGSRDNGRADAGEAEGEVCEVRAAAEVEVGHRETHKCVQPGTWGAGRTGERGGELAEAECQAGQGGGAESRKQGACGGAVG